MSENQLSGIIPTGLYNITSLLAIDVNINALQGSIPSDIGLTLPNLVNLYMGGNQLSGPIPTSLGNASGLQVIFFAVIDLLDLFL